MKLIVNKYTLELARRALELSYKKCRLEILEVIKRAPAEWRQKYIQAFQPTERELEIMNKNNYEKNL